MLIALRDHLSVSVPLVFLNMLKLQSDPRLEAA